jgi:predicted nuclease with RNAse H fold
MRSPADPLRGESARVALERPVGPFVALGVDPTAGDWRHGMQRGDAKAMSSVALEWDGRTLRLLGRAEHRENADLWRRCREVGASVVAIDGPCATNGLRVLPGWRGWDLAVRGGRRDGEVALSAAGVRIFWTTHGTVARFDGASRWIARSLRLFSDPVPGAPLQRIETHPHGAFLLLWRRLGRKGAPGHKARAAGRRARLALLSTFVSGAEGALLPHHDAVDAACAALVGALHALGATRAFGTKSGGGLIWLPDGSRILVR